MDAYSEEMINLAIGYLPRDLAQLLDINRSFNQGFLFPVGDYSTMNCFADMESYPFLVWVGRYT